MDAPAITSVARHALERTSERATAAAGRSLGIMGGQEIRAAAAGVMAQPGSLWVLTTALGAD